MKKNAAFLLLAAFCLLTGLSSATPAAESAIPLTDPLPAAKTIIELQDKEVYLDWSEDRLVVKHYYYLKNPAEKRVRISFSIALPPQTLPLDGETDQNKPGLKILAGESDIKLRYNAKKLTYSWDLPFQANEQMVLSLEYSLANSTENDLSLLEYKHLPRLDRWGKVSGKGELILQLSDIHPGQIKDIQPRTYIFAGNSLVWVWEDLSKTAPVALKVDLRADRNSWERLLSSAEKTRLEAYEASGDYENAAALLAETVQKTDPEKSEPLRVGQAYYLDKAQKTREAKYILEDLYDSRSKIPRVYWALGRLYINQPRDLLDLYNRVEDLQIHPLIQKWLVPQLPPNKVRPSAPNDFTEVQAALDSGQSGLKIKGKVADSDGDIEKIVLRYRWEEGAWEEKSIQVQPFRYEHSIAEFLKAPGSLKRLNYELIAYDSAGNKKSSSERGAFYLNNEVSYETKNYKGAVLVMGDYSSKEQSEVDKWFYSYLKMAEEADFVSFAIKEKNPYFILLNKKQSFLDNYQGSLFIMHAPEPFKPDDIRINYRIHRYLLSYCYGPGWKTLPDKELDRLGDALVLGRGRYALVIKYLAHKDFQKFADLLAAIGRGGGWHESLQEVYKMSFNEIQIRTVVYEYGNIVLAMLIIIAFAWLGKTGHLVKFIHTLKEKPRT